MMASLGRTSSRNPEGRRKPELSSRTDVQNSISYTAEGGGQVSISFPFNPYAAFGHTSIRPPALAKPDDVKLAFKTIIADQQRQNRAVASLSNHILTSTVPRYQQQQGTNLYTIKNHDHFVVAAYGNTQELHALIRRNRSLISVANEHGRTWLYLAWKSGFYDMVKMLLRSGADVNKVQRDGSTPLHGAAYFGHTLVVGLLLEDGARTDIKNRWDHTALQESESSNIKNLIQNASQDLITSLATKLKDLKLVSNVRLIEFHGNVIAKEFIRDPCALDVKTRSQLKQILKTWELTWHGTRFQYLEAILQKGLLPAGTEDIKPPQGHIALGADFLGVPNWAAAIFLSPSILYSAHAAYSQRVLSKREQWCVLVKAYCQPGSYKAYDPTVLSYKGMEGEPESPEYRVPVDKDLDSKEVNFRVESGRSVVVRSIVFIRASVLENREINFREAARLFRN